VGPDLAFALELAAVADAISLDRFRARDLVVETKPDLTPVTDADRAVEEEIRRRLTAERPDDGVLGEEYGDDGPSARRWIVDPIDGTRNYSRGLPVWGTLIALEADSAPVVGVVSAPALGRRWWAERGGGAFASGESIKVSRVSRVEDAVICLPAEHPLPSLSERAWLPRGYGDFWAHMLVAEGVADGAIDAVGVHPWDLAAVQVIVEEAGGRYSDASGGQRIDTRTGLTSNGLIHDELVAAAMALPI
jgi:histidinol-phosphatase